MSPNPTGASWKSVLKKVPGVRALYERSVALRWRMATPEKIFTEIFHKNRWIGDESRSGTGSALEQTARLVAELPALFRRLGIATLLDVPCGDFHWMSRVDLEGIDYLGGDIVAELVARNREEHGREGVRFERIDLLADVLPRVDLVLCRDVLVHLPFAAIRTAVANLKASGSTWLLTTTFPGRGPNRDIVMGHWRPLDLGAPPFDWPAPVELVNEGCTEPDEKGGIYAEKSLGLWRLEDL